MCISESSVNVNVKTVQDERAGPTLSSGYFGKYLLPPSVKYLSMCVTFRSSHSMDSLQSSVNVAKEHSSR